MADGAVKNGYAYFFSSMMDYIKPFSFILICIVIAYITLKSANSENIIFWKRILKTFLIIELVLILWAVSASFIDTYKQQNNLNNNILSTAPQKNH